VNTPRSDEDRLKLMELMVFLLLKDFRNTASVKRSDDVTRLQALVDRKKIVISEDIIREILQLDDAEGVVCLPNEEIFAGLARMGYEKPSTKLTFYKAFFSSQWKFLIHTLLQSLSAKRTFWNEFSTAMASAVICLSKGQKFNFSKYIFDSLVRNVDSSSKFYMYPRFIQLIIQNQVGDLSTHTTRYISLALTQKVFANMRWVGKGFSKVETPLFEGMLAARQLVEEELAEEQVQTDVAVDAAKLEIIKLKARVKRLERANKVKPSKLKRLRKVGHLVEVVTIAKLITDDVTAASQVIAASATISAAKPSIPDPSLTVVAAYTRRRKGVIIRDPKEELSLKTPAETPKLKEKGKGILVETPKPMKKKDQIELDAEYVRKLHEEINKDHEEINKDIDWDVAFDHVKQQSKNPQYIKRYHRMKKKPQTENEAHKNLIAYLKNTAGYKMDFFKGMSYDEIRLIFQARFDANIRFLFKTKEEMKEEDQEIIKSINETPAQKAAKRRKLNEKAQEAEELKKQLEIVNDEDDDLLELMLSKRSKKNTKFINATDEELNAAKHKLMLLKLKLFKDIAAAASMKSLPMGFVILTSIASSLIKSSSSNGDVLGEGERSGDVTRLQALVDKKKIVTSEDVIREILQLDDAEGVSAKRTSWNEFSTTMASAVICLSKGQRFNFSRHIFDSLVRNVDSSSKFYMYPHFIQLIIQAQVVDLSSHTTRYISPALTQKVFANMRRVGKGCSGVETPLFENMLEVREVDVEKQVQVPAHDDVDQENVTEEIADDFAQPTSPLPPSPVIPSSPPHQSPGSSPSQAAEGSSILEDDAEVQEAVEIVTTAKLMNEVVIAATTQLSQQGKEREL
nr:hypothetical protein [Tanacetum cinerariifolium]